MLKVKVRRAAGLQLGPPVLPAGGRPKNLGSLLAILAAVMDPLQPIKGSCTKPNHQTHFQILRKFTPASEEA